MNSKETKKKRFFDRIFPGVLLLVWGSGYGQISVSEILEGTIHCTDHGKSYWDISSVYNPFFFWALVSLRAFMAVSALALGAYLLFFQKKK